MILPHHFGKLLRKIRGERGWTQEGMAKTLGITRQALFLLETGRGLPSLPLAIRIAQLCKRSLDDIVMGDRNEQRKEVNMNRGWFDPFSELDRLHRELDRMFDESFRPALPAGRDRMGVEFPAVNVRETDKEVIIEAQLPGVTSKDLQVNVTEDHFSLRGERKSETETKDENFIRREYSYGSFAREVALPTPVKVEEADASLKNGLLTIRVPKKVESKPTGRELKIKEE
jgi:HSP20 family protein